MIILLNDVHSYDIHIKTTIVLQVFSSEGFIVPVQFAVVCVLDMKIYLVARKAQFLLVGSNVPNKVRFIICKEGSAIYNVSSPSEHLKPVFKNQTLGAPIF